MQAIGHLAGALGLAQAAKHHHELVAAHAAEGGTGHQVARRAARRDARHRVGAAQAAVESPRSLDQQFVAGPVAAYVLAARAIPESKEATHARFPDPVGILLLAGALSLLALGIV